MWPGKIQADVLGIYGSVLDFDMGHLKCNWKCFLGRQGTYLFAHLLYIHVQLVFYAVYLNLKVSERKRVINRE